jgi:hypothetical protein
MAADTPKANAHCGRLNVCVDGGDGGMEWELRNAARELGQRIKRWTGVRRRKDMPSGERVLVNLQLLYKRVQRHQNFGLGYSRATLLPIPRTVSTRDQLGTLLVL